MSFSSDYQEALLRIQEKEDPEGAYQALVKVMLRNGEEGCGAFRNRVRKVQCGGSYPIVGLWLCDSCWGKIRMRWLEL